MKSVSFSPDGNRIVYSSIDGLAVFDTQTGEMLFPLIGHKWIVSSAVYSPNGNFIVSAGEDKLLFIWNSKTGKMIHQLTGHTGIVNATTFSPDNKLVASASQDHTIKIWDAETGKERRTLYGHTGSIHSVSFSHDGNYIITTSMDGTIRIWDTASGNEIDRYECDSYAYAAAFTENDRFFISASLSYACRDHVDREIRIWDFPPLKQLIDETRKRFKTRPLTYEERRKYYLE